MAQAPEWAAARLPHAAALHGALMPHLSPDLTQRADTSLLTSPRPPAERNLLLNFKAGITNWDEAAAANGLTGWQPCGDSPVCPSACSWSGVECSPWVGEGSRYVTEV